MAIGSYDSDSRVALYIWHLDYVRAWILATNEKKMVDVGSTIPHMTMLLPNYVNPASPVARAY